MVEKDSRQKILQEFFNFPRKNFQMREISRNTGISQPSVINYLKSLVKDDLILKEKKGIYPTYRSNRENESFKMYKKMNLIKEMHKIGLVEHIYSSCIPDVIILFGSASKGEDIEESDIDLFVKSPEKKIKLETYEKQLNRKISLFFEENFLRLNKELKNNIINGIIIKGYLKVF